MEMAGLPWRLAGKVSRPLLPGPGVDAAEDAGQRAVGGERDVGVAGRDHEVDAVDRVEDARHRLVHLHAAALDLGASLGVVLADGRLHAEADLGGELVGALRPVVLQLRLDGDVAAERPGSAHARQVHVDALDPAHPGVGHQIGAGGLEQLPHHR